jgi:electron transfer flavoprotein beta subunit
LKKVVVCYKWVLDEADIRVAEDLSVDFSRAKGKISEYDKNAIETGVKAAAALEGQTIGLTFGTAGAKPSLKDALSRGLDEAIFVKSEAQAEAGSRLTAHALAGALKDVEELALVICAEGSSDMYAHQTAPRIGAILDLPVVTSVVSLTIEGDSVILVRKLGDCLETVRSSLPAVIAVMPEITPAPLPGLKAVLAAGKKPVTERELGEVTAEMRTEQRQLTGFVMNRKNVLIKDGSAEEKVAELLAQLKKEGAI